MLGYTCAGARRVKARGSAQSVSTLFLETGSSTECGPRQLADLAGRWNLGFSRPCLYSPRTKEHAAKPSFHLNNRVRTFLMLTQQAVYWLSHLHGSQLLLIWQMQLPTPLSFTIIFQFPVTYNQTKSQQTSRHDQHLWVTQTSNLTQTFKLLRLISKGEKFK